LSAVRWCSPFLNRVDSPVKKSPLFIALIALLPLVFVSPARALDCDLLQSSRLKPYEEARQGFEKG